MDSSIKNFNFYYSLFFKKIVLFLGRFLSCSGLVYLGYSQRTFWGAFLIVISTALLFYGVGTQLEVRFKIFYKTNSSLEKFLHRLFSGKIFFFIFSFLVFTLIPEKFYDFIFWFIWGVCIIFYSWPTRKKILENSYSNLAMPYRFLSPIEKSVIALTLLLFIIISPLPSTALSFQEILLSFSTKEILLHSSYKHFISFLYWPFLNHPNSISFIWTLHHSLLEGGICLLAFYATLRYIFSRKTSILGVFFLVASWPFSLLLRESLGNFFITSFCLFCLWSFLWAWQSQTYRIGIHLGNLCLWGSIIHPWGAIVPLGIIGTLLYTTSLQKTLLMVKQIAKYASVGFLLSVVIFLLRGPEKDHSLPFGLYFSHFFSYFFKKETYILAPIGFFILIFSRNFLSLSSLQFSFTFFLFCFIGLFFMAPSLLIGTHFLWPIIFLSLIPIDFLLHLLKENKAKRGILYFLYFILILLDSHLDGHLRDFYKITFKISSQ